MDEMTHDESEAELTGLPDDIKTWFTRINEKIDILNQRIVESKTVNPDKSKLENEQNNIDLSAMTSELTGLKESVSAFINQQTPKKKSLFERLINFDI